MILEDAFKRKINYLRLSVTDRCDFRCVYCMSEVMQFMPRNQLLSIEEMTLVARAFVELGVTKVRITGGEPLVRRNVTQLFHNLGALEGLSELSLTTNGSQLVQYAGELHRAGVRRVNISIDSLQPERFTALTRTGSLAQVLEGIDAAIAAGLRVKLNSVILKNRNFDEVTDLVGFALAHNSDISFIEEMPLGVIEEHQRDTEYCSSADLRKAINTTYPLTPTTDSTGGPSRYWKTQHHSESRIGFISPHSDNFCSSCNRVRVSADGRLLLCLGNEDSVDLRAVVREDPTCDEAATLERLKHTIIDAMMIKPEKHHFTLDESPQILRFMNTTGG